MREDTQTHKYLELYQTIRDNIILKIYPDKFLLPTETQLMEKYGVSRNTVRRAMELLREEGYIETRRGSGSIVRAQASLANSVPGAAKWKGSDTRVEYYLPSPEIRVSPAVVDTVPAPGEAAKAFSLSPSAPVYRVQCIWSINGIPYNYMVQYINPEILPGYDTHVAESRKIRDIIEKYWGLHCTGAEEHIICKNAGFVEAKLLDMKPGDAILTTYRFGWCEKGIMEYAEFYGNPAYTGYKNTICWDS